MTGDPDTGDYWIKTFGPETAVSKRCTPGLTVETINCAIPLDHQFGVAQPLTVPPTFRNALFGPPEGLENPAIEPLHTYGVLDAAKVQFLPEMLETSGLEHACLFQGQAAEDLSDVAPWIVRLEEGNPFTRALFTSGNGPHHLWDANSAIFLRAQGSLSDIRGHLRKFTQLRTETGTVEYFRFWETSVLDYIAFFDGVDLGLELFPDMHVFWTSHYYNSGPQFTVMRDGHFL